MKSIIRFGLVLLVAMIMVATPALSARAQGANCYGVPDADCQLLTAAGANSTGFAQGFNMDYKLNFKFAGNSGGTASTGDVNVTGTGAFGIAAGAAASASGASDPMAALSSLLFSNVINFSSNTDGKTQSGSVEVRLANGNVYFKSDMMGGKWQYITSTDAMTALSAMQKNMGGGAAGGTGGATGGMAAMNNPEMLAAIMAIPNIPGVIAGEAADGPTVDGQATRQITYNIDLAKLVGSTEFRPVIKAGLTQSAAGAEVTDAQIDDAVSKAGTALANSKLAFYVLVGSADKITHGFGVNFSLSVDEATAKLLSPNSTTAGSGDLSASFDITFSKVGQAVAVEAPADATKLDLGAMMGGAGK